MNLLPNKEKEDLKKGLKLRSLILTSFLLAASFLIGFVMLLPSYFLALGNFSKVTPENYLSRAKNENSAENILNLPQEIDSKLKFLQLNNDSKSAVDSIFQIIKYLPAGVELDSISFTRNESYKDKKGIVILISGIALDRDALVSFSTLLKESKLFSSVDVPVSNLTREKNLPFSMNIFIENQK